MPTEEFFEGRPSLHPMIYAYRLPGVSDHKGYLKVGYTEKDVATRIKEQLHTAGLKPEIVLKESAMRSDGTCFMDKQVHKELQQMGCANLASGRDRNEWFLCSEAQVREAILKVRCEKSFDGHRTQDFKMRPEQERAVSMTMDYFKRESETNPDEPPKFLWNAKMRFGKTFATYQLAKRMKFKRVLILTFKPAVESAWAEDLMSHVDFEGWQFISNKDAQNHDLDIDEEYQNANKRKPIVVFGSFQDLLGTNENGGIKAKNEFIHLETWDMVVFDEYHYGAWREKASKLFETEDEEADSDFDPEKYKREEADNAANESFLPITTSHYLYLSGTPFRALNSGEFIEEQIFSWTYSDEQKAKEAWRGSDNPYRALPRMVLLTYKLPDSIRQIAMQGEFDEFDLNVFFSAEGHGRNAKFKYENEVQKWLDLIRGSYLPSGIDDLKLGQDKRPPMPYADVRLLSVLQHTMWYLPNVASCEAMKNLLDQRHNTFYHDYKVIVCAGTQAGIGLAALKPVQDAMGDPLDTKTITLSCGKLNTGVTVRPWGGIFMLRNLKSPETYFQTAFRAQSPWTVKDENGDNEVIKNACYIFDFALERALRQISDYSRQLDIHESDPEKKVGNFIKFLPVLAYDGSTMKQINAQDILDIAMAGTSATLLARRWESALLVNVDNETLSRILASKEAMEVLSHIEGFRSLNQDIETILNKSEHVKKVKKEKEGKLTPKEKQELSDEEKEYKSKRKMIQEKLIKFATRVPIFMYLSEYRERSLKDVITLLEPELFLKVTGLDVKDFELLCSLGVFNSSLMDDAVYKFKRYEDSSLEYTGVNKHEGEDVGGFETTMTAEEYKRFYYNQQDGMSNIDSGFSEAIRVYDAGEEPEETPETDSDEEEVIPVKTVRDTANAENNGKEYDNVTTGSTVLHKTLGKGTVIKIASSHIHVKFKSGKKMFMYPDAFKNKILTIYRGK